MTRLFAGCKISFVTGAPSRVAKPLGAHYASAWGRLVWKAAETGSSNAHSPALGSEQTFKMARMKFRLCSGTG
jgi:hypothetical protein